MNNAKLIFVTAISIAVVFTFSCSSSDDSGSDDIGDNDDTSSSSNESSSSSSEVVLTECPIYNSETHFCDSRDFKVYKFVEIGNQTWMADNLNYNVPNSTNDMCYGKNSSNCDTYGRLYDWETAKTACPQGWYLPSNDEWAALVNFVGDSSATKLKAANGWPEYKILENRFIMKYPEGRIFHDLYELKEAGMDELRIEMIKSDYGWPDGISYNGTNDYEFSALPGGYDNSSFFSNNIGSCGSWWSATQAELSFVHFRTMCYFSENLERNSLNRENLLSVRCLKDKSKHIGEGPFTDPRDGQIYNSEKIGNQIWMTKNLNYNASSSVCYDNKAYNCTTYGRLYDWNTAMSACPNGWHLPSLEEWYILIYYAGGNSTGGKHLRATSGWNNNGNGLDTYGFAALPGGARVFKVDFNAVGRDGYWWSASEYGNKSDFVYIMFMDSNYESIREEETYKDHSFSVRCIQD
jgi:uncharacterized protein (TIGR02145 family)